MSKNDKAPNCCLLLVIIIIVDIAVYGGIAYAVWHFLLK